MPPQIHQGTSTRVRKLNSYMSCHQPFRANQNLQFLHFTLLSPTSSLVCTGHAGRLQAPGVESYWGFMLQPHPWKSVMPWAPHLNQHPLWWIHQEVSDRVLCWFVHVYFLIRHAYWKFKPQGQYLLLPTGYWEDLIKYAWYNRHWNSWRLQNAAEGVIGCHIARQQK